MALGLLIALCYAIFRIAVDYNITPWKWIVRFVLVFLVSLIPFSIGLIAIYGEQKMSDFQTVEKITNSLLPFILLYQVVLFFFFRSRIIRYVHALDEIDNNNNNHHHTPGPPSPPSKDPKDFSYFR